MGKINIKQITGAVKEIIKNSCVIFAVLTFFIGLLGYFIGETTMKTQAVFIGIIYALLIAASYKVFAIKAIPAISRHIIFFALMYVSFMFVYMPFVHENINAQTTLYLTIVFIAAYLVCFGVVQTVKYITRNARNKKEKYEKQF
jgi:CDP-diglyceride synthetase